MISRLHSILNGLLARFYNLYFVKGIKEKNFYDDFESGISKKWSGYEAANKNRIRIVKDPMGGVKNVVKFTLHPDDLVCKGNRAELKKFLDYPPSSEAWHSFNFLIPKNYKETSSDNWQVIVQWMYQPNTLKGHTWDTCPEYDPPIAITYGKTNNGNGVLSLRYGVKDNSLKPVAQKRIIKGEWNNLVLHIGWSTKKDGFVEAWLNKKALTPFNGKNYKVFGQNMYNPLPNYLKIGLYGYYGTDSVNSVYYSEVKVEKSAGINQKSFIKVKR
ncbi:heparin lyase I family protein [Candidatus Woesearchaeota archaeon]|nr:heparin lyase I family protein [Candidatus Woesearchaeota archaeon]